MTKTSLKVTLLDLLENCNVCRYLDKLKLYYAFSFLGAAPPAESAPGLLLPTFSLQATEHTIASDFFPSDIFTLLKSSHEFEPPSKSLSHRQECSPCEVLNREDQVQNESERDRIENVARPMQHLVDGGATGEAVDA